MYCVRGAKKTHTPKIRGVIIESKIKSPRVQEKKSYTEILQVKILYEKYRKK